MSAIGTRQPRNRLNLRSIAVTSEFYVSSRELLCAAELLSPARIAMMSSPSISIVVDAAYKSELKEMNELNWDCL